MSLPEPRTKAHDFELEGADGRTYELATALAKGPVLIVFFETECPTCGMVMPLMEKFRQGYAMKTGHFTVWGISREVHAEVQKFVKSKGFKFPVLLDPPRKQPTFKGYGVERLPAIVLVDTDGTVLAALDAWDRQKMNEFSRKVAGLLAVPYLEISNASDGRPEQMWTPDEEEEEEPAEEEDEDEDEEEAEDEDEVDEDDEEEEEEEEDGEDENDRPKR
ncbi:MAG: TlpA disulfide reductase family protein [Planctomycetota bacterium]